MAKECVILVADLDAEYAVRGLLTCVAAMDCRSFTFDLFRHPRRDPGVRIESGEFLRALSAASYNHAVLILDRHGSGVDSKPAIDIENTIENDLPVPWKSRTAAIVIDPELEAWVWSDSPAVDRVLGWQGREPALREWLAGENLCPHDGQKPADPKLAYERALRKVHKARSAAIFETLGRTVSTRRCSDRAFIKLRETLHDWFPSP